MRKSVPIALLCLLFGMSNTAFAHAHLLSSDPQANGTIQGPAITIDLKFDSLVDSSGSRLALILPSGKVESLKITAPRHSELGAQTQLNPGKYVIQWQALSTDGHITRGEIPFTVR
jgi:copper resistance protein C